MDKIVVNKLSDIIKDKNGYIIFSDLINEKNVNLKIINSNLTILDNSNFLNKNIVFENSKVSIIEINKSNDKKYLNIHNHSSDIEYNIIDLYDNNVEYHINEEIVSNGAQTHINVASISYKQKNKNYVINTSNLGKNSINNINCFGIVKDYSKLNYDITSFIKNGASKSVVRQSSNILLFDEESVGKSNPILVIEENDVKANHGSSIGKIDDETMFYLCSRGLSKGEATNLICLGKVSHLLDKIEDKEIKENLIDDFKERMI